MKRKSMRAWNVYSGGKKIDTVFYVPEADADYVRRGLIEHDGYPADITVRTTRTQHGRGRDPSRSSEESIQTVRTSFSHLMQLFGDPLETDPNDPETAFMWMADLHDLEQFVKNPVAGRVYVYDFSKGGRRPSREELMHKKSTLWYVQGPRSNVRGVIHKIRGEKISKRQSSSRHLNDPSKITTRERRALRPSQFALPKRRALPLSKTRRHRFERKQVANAASRLAQMCKRGTATKKECRTGRARIERAERELGMGRRRDPKEYRPLRLPGESATHGRLGKKGVRKLHKRWRSGFEARMGEIRRDPPRSQRRPIQRRQTETFSQTMYEANEVARFRKDLDEVEKAPLSERKEGAREFAEAMANEPELVAERVGWLLNGSYGYGSYHMARQVVRGRGNTPAWLTQVVGAIEWRSPFVMTRAAWNKLTPAQKARLAQYVDKEIKDHLAEE